MAAGVVRQQRAQVGEARADLRLDLRSVVFCGRRLMCSRYSNRPTPTSTRLYSACSLSSRYASTSRAIGFVFEEIDRRSYSDASPQRYFSGHRDERHRRRGETAHTVVAALLTLRLRLGQSTALRSQMNRKNRSTSFRTAEAARRNPERPQACVRQHRYRFGGSPQCLRNAIESQYSHRALLNDIPSCGAFLVSFGEVRIFPIRSPDPRGRGRRQGGIRD